MSRNTIIGIVVAIIVIIILWMLFAGGDEVTEVDVETVPEAVEVEPAN